MSKSAEVTPPDIGRHWMEIAEDPDTTISGKTHTEENLESTLGELGRDFEDTVKNALFEGEVEGMSSANGNVGNQGKRVSSTPPDRSTARLVAQQTTEALARSGIKIVLGPPGRVPKISWDRDGNISLALSHRDVLDFDEDAQRAGYNPGDSIKVILGES